MNYKAQQKEFIVKEFSNLQLYLLSVASGIAVGKENMEFLQQYVDCVYAGAHKSGVTDPKRVFAYFLGDPSEDGEAVRSAARKIINESAEFEHEANPEIYDKSMTELLNRHKDILLDVPLYYQDIFDELTREYFWLHAAMLVPGAVGLRKYHLGMSDVKPMEIVERFERSMKEYYADYFQKEIIDKDPDKDKPAI